jgi:hypothetical protein
MECDMDVAVGVRSMTIHVAHPTANPELAPLVDELVRLLPPLH